MHSARGQSEVVGSILLVAVIVIAVSTIGTIVFGGILSEDDPVSAVIDGDVTLEDDGTVRFQHGGGDSLAAADLAVVARSESTDRRLSFTVENIRGNGDEYFDPGERWIDSNISFGTGERVRLLLVHEPTGTVLFDGVRTPT